MADIELVIKIDEEDYKNCIKYDALTSSIYKAIQRGTPLPKGQWLRMSDLSEQEDDRYKCSHCGNVIHHKSSMNLYTFNSWCGRCGSNNGRHSTIIEATEE